MHKIAFFGTDEFSIAVLNSLKDKSITPDLIVTVPDKPKGRKLVLTPTPAKLWAKENNIPCIDPSSLKYLDENTAKQLNSAYSLFIVASYGKIIPDAILSLPKHGALNVHPSLLPKYRGATPLESTILAGDEITGVTIIKLDAEMDHGPIVARQEIDISDKPFYDDLRDRLGKLGGEILAEIIPKFVNGEINLIEQDHTQATFTKKIEKIDGEIRLGDDPEINYRKIRAFTPWPGAYFFIHKNGRELRVLIKKARLEDGLLKIESVVPEGKNEMDWDSFSRGYLSQ